MQSQTIIAGGINTHFWQAGEEFGRAVLLLHGASGDAQHHWQETIAVLSDEFRVIAPDLPAFGKTAALASDQLSAYLQWLHDFLTSLQLEQAVLIGHDFGALLARLFAAAEPVLVPVAVLISGGILPGTAPATRFLLRIPGIKDILINRATAAVAAPAALRQSVHSSHPNVIDDAFLASVKANLSGTHHVQRLLKTSALPSARTPALPVMLVWGIDDPLVPLKEAQYLQTRIPSAQLVELAECGHFPHLEAPDTFIFQVRQFLTTLGRPQKRGPGAGRLRG